MTTMLQPSFILKSAALANWLGVLIFSKLLTNHAAFGKVDPLFSLTGLILILVWGLAFWSVSLNPQAMRPLLLVFVVEKLVYALNHGLWFFKGGSVAALLGSDMLLGIFYVVYGANDALYALLFFVAYRKTKPG